MDDSITYFRDFVKWDWSAKIPMPILHTCILRQVHTGDFFLLTQPDLTPTTRPTVVGAGLLSPWAERALAGLGQIGIVWDNGRALQRICRVKGDTIVAKIPGCPSPKQRFTNLPVYGIMGCEAVSVQAETGLAVFIFWMWCLGLVQTGTGGWRFTGAFFRVSVRREG